MNIYFKQRLKTGLAVVVVSLVLIALLWLLVFVTDFVMYNLDRPMLFCKTTIIDKDDMKITKEQGLGYYYVTDNITYEEFYLFGKKIKQKVN